ncbi:MAG: hypothetical protein ACR2FH_10230, partial [Caulobacteraceae bacterium]
HKLGNEGMIDHIVDLVEARAAQIEAAEAEEPKPEAGAPALHAAE